MTGRPSAQAESRREEVLQHARAVIIRDGLDGTSLRRIAREGGFSTGVLSHYFADKQELITACFEWTIEGWLSRVEEEVNGAGSPEDSVVRFAAVFMPRTSEDDGEWRLWLNVVWTAVYDQSLTDLLVGTERRFEELLTTALARWADAGLIRETLPRPQQAGLLSHLGNGLALQAMVTGDWDQARERLVRALAALGLPTELAERARFAYRDAPTKQREP